jgi:hypothetical protein
MDRSQSSRRTFLSTAFAGSAGLLVLRSSRTALGYAANDRINLAVLGHMYVADHFLTSVHIYENVGITALCNPDQRKIPDVFKGWQDRAKKLADSARAEDRKAAEHYRRYLENKPPVYADFRKMLDQRGKEIDAMVVSMYEHYHGAACGTAMRAGKHVFCERPLGRTVRESRDLRELAAKQKVATSIRNPGNASQQFRRGLELVREGILGPVEEVHVWFDRGGPDLQQTPQGTQPVPEGLDWDAWLGPAAMRPYHPEWMAYAQWREFCNGGIGTFGPHASNLAFMSLAVHDLWKPVPDGKSQGTVRVQAECSRINRLSFPRWEVVRWKVPARGSLPPVTFTWHNGPGCAPGSREKLQKMMAERGASSEEQKKLFGYAGAMLVGSKGILATDDHNVKFTLLPRDKFEGVKQDAPQKVPSSRGHYADWFLACRGGEPAWAHFGYANPLSEFLMLGNVATQFEGELEYDPVACRIVNRREADQALSSYQYRQGWAL